MSRKPTWDDCLAYVTAHCQDGCGDMPAGTVKYAELLWQLSESIQATTILEIGIGPTSLSGCTFLHSLARRVKRTNRPDVLLVSVDIDPTRPAARYVELAEALRVPWLVYGGDSLEDPLRAGFAADLLYIDGNHDYAHAYGDVRTYLRYLRPGGLLVLDDYPGWEGVEPAVRQLERDGLTFTFTEHTPGNGRAICRLPLGFRFEDQDALVLQGGVLGDAVREPAQQGVQTDDEGRHNSILDEPGWGHGV